MVSEIVMFLVAVGYELEGNNFYHSKSNFYS